MTEQTSVARLYSAWQDKAITVLGSHLPLSDGPLVSVFRCGDRNVGDLYSSPALYFDELREGESLDILGYRAGLGRAVEWLSTLSHARVLVGGGGLLNRPTFASSMEFLASLAVRGKKIVLWGVGDNSPSFAQAEASIRYRLDLDAFPLVGIRDYGQRWRWVPCASCLAPQLKHAITIQREIGVVLHHADFHSVAFRQLSQEFPCRYNNHDSFEDLITFIGQCEYLLTNSYHAMYWGILMGRKVIVFPNSSKMFHFKYQVPIGLVSDYRALMKSAVEHPEALEECRRLNLEFAADVFDYLGL